MADTGNKDTVNNIIVEKTENRSHAEIMASNERIEKMEQLNRKLTVKKTGMTKEIKKNSSKRKQPSRRLEQRLQLLQY